MRIQILAFMVLAIQVCSITCVDLDTILSAVEEEQQATRTMSPTPGILYSSTTLCTLFFRAAETKSGEGVSRILPWTSQPPLLYAWGLATTANQILQFLVNSHLFVQTVILSKNNRYSNNKEIGPV